MKRHASMNRAYRLVWSRIQSRWIAVAENARGRGKSISGRKLMAVAMGLLAPLSSSMAAPTGGQVTAGSGTISSSGSTTTITQGSQNLSLSWQGFNTAANETVNFVQPSASAVAVNRIRDTNGTQFFGRLNANGQVYLINPNGILFGAGSQVNVGGLVASTLDVSDASLGATARSFSGSGTGSIVNQGTINGNYVAFLGNTVRNQGTITAHGGTAALGAGSAVTLTFAGNSLVKMQVDRNTLNNLAENGGLIRADGGRVLMSAGAKDTLLASVVNNAGVIEARSVQNINGTIVLDGGRLGMASNSGTLDASGKGAGETGGTVKVLGNQVELLAGSTIDVSGDQGGGTALIGGNYQGKGPEQNAQTASVATGAAIRSDALTNGDGGLAVVWSDGHTTFDGTISARGGARGGDGGQVETSGHKLTIGQGARVATLAPLGTAGNWLLDPNDFVIHAAGDPGDMLDTDLNAALELGSVTITTTGSGASCTGVVCGAGTAGNGDIIISTGATNAYVIWSANTTLTLSAYRNVVVNGWIDTLNSNPPGTAGSIVLRADNTGTGTGTVTVAAGVSTGGNGFIATGTGGSTTIYYNPASFTAALPNGYAADNVDFYGTFTVKKLLNINSASASAQNKTYDGTTGATLNTAFTLLATPDGVTAGQRVSLSAGTASFADKNVGSGKAVSFSGYTLTGADAGNYFLTGQPASKTANITAKALTATITASNKTYNANTTATPTFTITGGLVGTETVTATGTATFADKNVGNGKTVTSQTVTLADGTNGGLASNYSLAAGQTTTANITPANLTVTGVTASNKTYDATTAATLNGTASVTALGGDVVSVGGTGSGTFADKSVGNGKAVTVTGYTLSGADAGNYNIVQPTGLTANITKASLTVTGIIPDSKTYDGTTSATLSGTATVFGLGGDTVSVSGTGSGTFADKNAGTGKAVTITGYTLSGADAGNYNIVQPSGVANINKVNLTVTASSVTKTYDGTTTASGSATLGGTLAAGDSVNASATQVFLDRNAGTGKTVRASGLTIKDGSNVDMSGNYNISYVDNTTSVINKALLSVSGITASNKTYDGTTAATVNAGGAVLTGLVGGDAVTVSATGSFANKNVGNGKTVTLVSSYGGADAGNYTITDQASTTANITAKGLTVSGITTSNKTYDGTTAATVNTGGVVLTGKVGGDAVTVSATGTFADKNAGNGKTVTLVSSYGGADAGNYSITDQASTTANIAQKSLTLSGITASNKTYDGTTAATLNAAGVTFTGLVGADVVTLGGAGVGAFADKNVGTGKTVTVSGYTLGGADGGNYSVGQPTGLTADITAKSLTVSGITASNKTYDGTTAATVNAGGAVLTGLVGGDAVTVSATGTFANKNVGNGKTVTLVSSYGGADAGNYTITDQASTTANITAKGLTVSGITASNKTYDGTTAATVNTGGVVLTGKVGGDAVTVGATGTFADKNAGNGKTVTLVSSYGGADAGNYSITDQASTTANITAKALTLSGITASNKTYDGTTAATLNAAGVTFTGLVGADVVTLGGAGVGAFADKNVGTGKTVTVSGYTLGGADGGNYSVGQPTGLTADITAKSLTVSGITASNKTYDGTTAATVNAGGAVLTGLVGGDAVTVSATGSFANKNVGNGKTVTIAVGGADAGNYALTQPGLTANITPKGLTVSGITASNKIYDGTTAATVNTAGAVLTGKVGGDAVTVSATGTFADKNAGNGKTVTLVSSYGGADAGNYSITDQASTTANIAPKSLTVMANSHTKTHDGVAYSGGNGVTYAGFVAGETETVLGGALTYGGSSQGALAAGNYIITPGGQTSSNYALNFVDGALVINAAPTAAPPAAQNAATQVVAQLAGGIVIPKVSPTITVSRVSSTVSAPAANPAPNSAPRNNAAESSQGEQNSERGESEHREVVNVAMNVSRGGPMLRIMNGGMRLPQRYGQRHD